MERKYKEAIEKAENEKRGDSQYEEESSSVIATAWEKKQKKKFKYPSEPDSSIEGLVNELKDA
jgi:hypothetical protein